MYVDKRLAGIQAVQTLSRLNRTHPLREDTFILDFVNERGEIQEAFKQFYEGAVMGEEVDFARLYEIKAELDRSGTYLPEEVERFCEVFFQAKARQSFGDHKAMNAALDSAVDRFRGLQQANEDEAELWRGRLWAFRNRYAFLSQIIPYQDSDLERLYAFLRHLAPKLPRRGSGPAYQFDDQGSAGILPPAEDQRRFDQSEGRYGKAARRASRGGQRTRAGGAGFAVATDLATDETTDQPLAATRAPPASTPRRAVQRHDPRQEPGAIAERGGEQSPSLPRMILVL